jgi:hypothetical protein
MATHDGARELNDGRFLPLGVGLRDPSRMRKEEVEKICKLWMHCQGESKIPLQFKVAEAK